MIAPQKLHCTPKITCFTQKYMTLQRTLNAAQSNLTLTALTLIPIVFQKYDTTCDLLVPEHWDEKDLSNNISNKGAILYSAHFIWFLTFTTIIYMQFLPWCHWHLEIQVRLPWEVWWLLVWSQRVFRQNIGQSSEGFSAEMLRHSAGKIYVCVSLISSNVSSGEKRQHRGLVMLDKLSMTMFLVCCQFSGETVLWWVC